LRGNGVAQQKQRQKLVNVIRFNPLARQRGCATATTHFVSNQRMLGFNPLARQRGCATEMIPYTLLALFGVFQSSCEATGLRNAYLGQFSPGACLRFNPLARQRGCATKTENVLAVIAFGFNPLARQRGCATADSAFSQDPLRSFNPLARQRGCATMMTMRASCQSPLVSILLRGNGVAQHGFRPCYCGKNPNWFQSSCEATGLRNGKPTISKFH